MMLSTLSFSCFGECIVLCCILCLLGTVKGTAFAIKELCFAETPQLQLHIILTTLSCFALQLQILHQWDPQNFGTELHLGIRFKWAKHGGNRKSDSHETSSPPVRTTQSVIKPTLYYLSCNQKPWHFAKLSAP